MLRNDNEVNMADITKRVIYKRANGTIAYLIPSPSCELSIEEIAQKDVPTGSAYKIVDASYIPTDKTFREAWTIDDSELNDGVGSSEGNTETELD